jgi:hypothetical protein
MSQRYLNRLTLEEKDQIVVRIEVRHKSSGRILHTREGDLGINLNGPDLNTVTDNLRQLEEELKLSVDEQIYRHGEGTI